MNFVNTLSAIIDADTQKETKKMAKQKTVISPVVETEVRSWRATKAHTSRWLNEARRAVAYYDQQAVVFGAMINAGDNSDMTAISLSQAREAAHRARNDWRRHEEQIAKIDERIATLIQYGAEYDARRAEVAEGGAR
jgi:hypothetical protein